VVYKLRVIRRVIGPKVSDIDTILLSAIKDSSNSHRFVNFVSGINSCPTLKFIWKPSHSNFRTAIFVD